MKSALSALVALLSLSMGTAAAVQQATPNAALSGTVRRADTGAPIAGARVLLTRVVEGEEPPEAPSLNIPLEGGRVIDARYDPSDPKFSAAPASTGPVAFSRPPIAETIAGGDGTFRLAGLEPGNYGLTVIANGFVRHEYGQRFPGGPGKGIALAATQTISELAIRLTATGSVAGRIHDEAGGPLGGVPVYLFRYIYDSEGDRRMHIAGSARTVDRGAYRIFWVTPGPYYLGTGGLRPGMGFTNYVATFHPNTTDVAAAGPIDIVSGGEAVVNLAPTPGAFKLRIRVIDAITGASPVSWSPNFLYLIGRTFTGEPFAIHSVAFDDATGMIEVENLVPGIYEVIAEGGSASVQMVDRDVEGVRLGVTRARGPALKPVRGRLKLEGATELPDDENLLLLMHPVRPFREGSWSSLAFDFDSFKESIEIDVNSTAADPQYGIVQGDAYRVSISGLPKGWYARAAKLGEHDALAGPVVFTAGAEFEITLSARGGRVEGVARGRDGKPVEGADAILVPASGRGRAQLFGRALSDRDGRFVIEGIAPGDYKLFAWDGLEPNAFFDSAFIERFESAGAAVHVFESSRQAFDVTVIPVGDTK